MKTKLLFLWLAVSAMSPATAMEIRSQTAPASIRYMDSQVSEQGARGYRFRATNLSKATLFFEGYSADSPLYEVRYRWLSLLWRSLTPGWCGTGVKDYPLAAGKALRFWVHDPGTVQPWQIGLPLRWKRPGEGSVFTVWSDRRRR